MIANPPNSTAQLGYCNPSSTRHFRRGRVNDWYGRQRKCDEGRCENGGEKVKPEHHLLSGYVFVSREDLVLCTVCGTIDYEVDQQQEDAPHLALRFS